MLQLEDPLKKPILYSLTLMMRKLRPRKVLPKTL